MAIIIVGTSILGNKGRGKKGNTILLKKVKLMNGTSPLGVTLAFLALEMKLKKIWNKTC